MAMLNFERKYRVRGGTLIAGICSTSGSGPSTSASSASRPSSLSSSVSASSAGRLAWPDVEPLPPLDQSAAGGIWSKSCPSETGRDLAGGSLSAPRERSSSWHCVRWRYVDKLGMGYHVPFAFSFAILAYVTLVIFRPIAMGSWSYGLPYGFSSHLDCVSGTGYTYGNFHYNPAHMIAITFFFTTTLALALHGALVCLRSTRRRAKW